MATFQADHSVQVPPAPDQVATLSLRIASLFVVSSHCPRYIVGLTGHHLAATTALHPITINMFSFPDGMTSLEAALGVIERTVTAESALWQQCADYANGVSKEDPVFTKMLYDRGETLKRMQKLVHWMVREDILPSTSSKFSNETGPASDNESAVSALAWIDKSLDSMSWQATTEIEKAQAQTKRGQIMDTISGALSSGVLDKHEAEQRLQKLAESCATLGTYCAHMAQSLQKVSDYATFVKLGRRGKAKGGPAAGASERPFGATRIEGERVLHLTDKEMSDAIFKLYSYTIFSTLGGDMYRYIPAIRSVQQQEYRDYWAQLDYYGPQLESWRKWIETARASQATELEKTVETNEGEGVA